MKRNLMVGAGLLLIGMLLLLLYMGGSKNPSPGSEESTTSLKVADGWSRYQNSSFHFSFEYPSQRLSVSNQTSSYIEFSAGDASQNDASAPRVSVGVLGEYTYPATSSPATNSLEELLNMEANEGGHNTAGPIITRSVVDVFPSLRYVTVDGIRIALTNGYDTKTASESNILLFFIIDRTPYSMTIQGLSPEDTRHIWESLKFSQQ